MSRAALIAALLVACGKSSPPAPAADPAAAGLAARLDWLPADTALIASQKPPGAVLTWLQTVPGELPACVATLAARIDAVYGFARAMSERQVNAIHLSGAAPRAEIEACAKEVSAFFDREMGRPFTVQNDGELTSLSQDGQEFSTLAFTGDNWVLEGERARVTHALARKTRLSENRALAALLPRVEKDGGDWWMVGTMDMTGRLLGVPSSGMVLRTVGQKEEMRVPVALLFSSPAEAERAIAAFDRKTADPALPEVVRDAFRQLGAKVEGSEVVLDLAPLFSNPDPALVPALQQMLSNVR